MLIYVFASFTISNAQSGQITYGAKGGINYSAFMQNDVTRRFEDIGYIGKLGFYVGGFMSIDVSENFIIQPELTFALQGSAFKSDNIIFISEFSETVGNYRSNINEYVIGIPISGRYFINGSLCFEAGPRFTYTMQIEENVIQVPAQEFNISGDSSFNDLDKFDFGVFVGLGHKFSNSLALNARYFFSAIKRNETIRSSILGLGIEYCFY